MSESFIPSGVIPAVLLPFDSDLNIDEAAYRSHLRDLLEVEGDLTRDVFRVLVGNEPGGELGRRLGRDHGLGPFVGEAAPDAVDVQRRPGPDPFERRVPRFAPELGRVDRRDRPFCLSCAVSLAPAKSTDAVELSAQVVDVPVQSGRHDADVDVVVETDVGELLGEDPLGVEVERSSLGRVTEA